MTKAELRGAYLKARGGFEAGETFTNEYALHLDEMLAGYFGLRPADWLRVEGDVPEPVPQP